MIMRISVIIPAFNAEKHLMRAVASMLHTDYSDLEIVIIDDGSKDQTWNIAQQLQGSYPEIVKCYKHPDGQNHGIAESRNLAIKNSNGDLICFLDADDFVYPHRFATAAPILENDATIDAVYETTTMVDEDGHGSEKKWWGTANLFGFGVFEPTSRKELAEMLLKGFSWHTGAILCRRSLINRVGPFELDAAEEYDIWLRMACVGRIVPGDMDRPVSAYCRHGLNTYKPIIERKIFLILAMINAYLWAIKEKLPRAILKILSQGIREYCIRSVVVAIDDNRKDIAWQVIQIVMRTNLFWLIQDVRLLRQLLWLGRDKITQEA